jgi:restriction system protein
MISTKESIMSVPDFQTIMLPLLKLASDGRDHTIREACDVLADQFHLSLEEQAELTPSGRQKRFANRVAWAKIHLTRASLLESPARAHFRIVVRGADLLKSNPPAINIKMLRQYPEYVEVQRPPRKNDADEETEETRSGQTPEEIFEASYQSLRRALAEELLERVRNCSPQFFEHLVVELMLAMGYGGSREEAGKSIGRSGDEGVDGIIKEDKLGLDVIYLQAKRWDSTIGRPVVQAFAGSLEGQRAKKGVLITTSQFSNDAKDYVSRIEKKIVLIDGQLLSELMIDHDIGVSKITSYDIKKVDSDYFVDEY